MTIEMHSSKDFAILSLGSVVLHVGYGPIVYYAGVKMSKSGTVKQLAQLLIEKKAWWLIPMVSVFLLVGTLLVMTQGSALSPFIYALF
jgi:hypothetical protein